MKDVFDGNLEFSGMMENKVRKVRLTSLLGDGYSNPNSRFYVHYASNVLMGISAFIDGKYIDFTKREIFEDEVPKEVLNMKKNISRVYDMGIDVTNPNLMFSEEEIEYRTDEPIKIPLFKYKRELKNGDVITHSTGRNMTYQEIYNLARQNILSKEFIEKGFYKRREEVGIMQKEYYEDKVVPRPISTLFNYSNRRLDLDDKKTKQSLVDLGFVVIRGEIQPVREYISDKNNYQSDGSYNYREESKYPTLKDAIRSVYRI